jgi:hypothetical protein
MTEFFRPPAKLRWDSIVFCKTEWRVAPLPVVAEHVDADRSSVLAGK